MSVVNSGFLKHLGKAASPFILAAAIAAAPLIQEDEGRRLVPYQDIAGIWTDCDGNTKNVIPGRLRTHEECDGMTHEDALLYAKNVAEHLQLPIPKQTFISHIRMSYNIGMGSYNASTTLRLTNQGDIVGGCDAMMKFVCYKPSKKEIARGAKLVTKPGAPCYSQAGNRAVSPGLKNRRERERKQCLAGLDNL